MANIGGIIPRHGYLGTLKNTTIHPYELVYTTNYAQLFVGDENGVPKPVRVVQRDSVAVNSSGGTNFITIGSLQLDILYTPADPPTIELRLSLSSSSQYTLVLADILVRKTSDTGTTLYHQDSVVLSNIPMSIGTPTQSINLSSNEEIHITVRYGNPDVGTWNLYRTQLFVSGGGSRIDVISECLGDNIEYP